MSKTTKKIIKKPHQHCLMEVQSVVTDKALVSCVVKHTVRSLVLLPYLSGRFRIRCCLGGAPYPSAGFAEAFLCSWCSCFPNILSNYSGFWSLTSPFLLQLCFASANEKNQQTPFVACISYLPWFSILQFPLFLQSVGALSVRKWQALAKSALSWEWLE